MADRSVRVVLRAEIGQYKAAMAEAAKSTKGVSKEGAKASAEGKAFVENWSKASGPLLAVGGAITAVGVAALKTGVSYNQLQQQSRAALTTILGSAEAANAQMDKLDEFARTSPFSKQTFISAQQQMLAFGIETKRVLPYLDAIQDAVAAAGGNNTQISELAAIFSKVHAASKLTAQDLMEFGNRGVDAATLIGSQMGKTGAQIREEITAGTLDADAALEALANGMNARFDGAAENVKNTFTGALDRVSAAWRDLSSELAEPFVGKEGGGLFTALLNEVADFMRAIQGLPGPVKAAGAGITSLVGVGTLAAGTYLTLAPRILATRTALNELAQSGSSAAIGMQKVGTAAGKVAGPLTALAGVMVAVNTAFELLDRDSAASVEDMTGAILDLTDGARTLNVELSNSRGLRSMIKGTDEFTATINEAWEGTEGFNAAMANTFSLGGMLGALNPYRDALEDVKAYDEALTSLVASGGTEEAARGFEWFSQKAKDAGRSTEDIAKMLPGYTAAMKDAANQTRIGADNASDAINKLKARHEAAVEAVKEVREEAGKQARSFITLGKSLNDSKVSLGDWTKELEKQARALEQFTANAEKAAKRGLDEGLIASLREAGPEGAMRMKQLAGATDEEIARASAAWRRGQEAVGDYVGSLAAVPEKRVTRLEVKMANMQALDAFRSAINSLPSSWTTTLRTQRGPGPRPGPQAADGGLWSGRVRKYADGGFDEFGRPVQRVPQIRSGSQGTVMWGEPETGWEAYVSGKPSQKPRNRAILSEAASRLGGSVQWFADGGFTEAVTARELTQMKIRVRDLRRSLKETEEYGKKGNRKKRYVLRGLDRLEARQELREAEAELAEQNRIRRTMKRHGYKTSGQYNRAMEKQEQAREDAADAKENRQSVASSFADGLAGDAFKSPASLERALANMLRDSAEFTTLLAQLRKAGASPWLLEQMVKAGPSRATNRTAKALLADTARLKRLNAMSGGIVSVGNQYAALTTGAGFSASFSGAAGFDYNALARAMSQVQIIAPVTPRTAAQITQAGTKFAEVHA